jgi:hypothetical protein
LASYRLREKKLLIASSSLSLIIPLYRDSK